MLVITRFPQHPGDHSAADNPFLPPLDLWTGREICSRPMTNVQLPLRYDATGYRFQKENNYERRYVTGKNGAVVYSFISSTTNSCEKGLFRFIFSFSHFFFFIHDTLLFLLHRINFLQRTSSKRNVKQEVAVQFPFRGFKTYCHSVFLTRKPC